MDLGGYSAIGPREANEDSYYYLDFSSVNSFSNGAAAFVMVSDGMGGYQGGDVASQLAVENAQAYLDRLLNMARGNQVELDAHGALVEIIQAAHAAIIDRAAQLGGANMGATFVGAFISPAHAWIAHVGDSRAYLVRNGQAIQLTEDHSQVGKMLSRGLITEEEAQNHPARNRIERALGFADAQPDFNETDLLPGDELLLCSDGVYTVVGAAGLVECLAAAENAQDAAQYVVGTALNRGTDDNSTAVVAALRPAPAAASAGSRTLPTLGEHNQPRHASPVHTERQAARPSAGAASKAGSARPRGSAKRIVIPLVVVAVLAVVIVLLFLNAQSGEQSMPGTAGTSPAATPPAAGATGGSGQGAAGSQPTMGQGASGGETQGTETEPQLGTENAAGGAMPAGYETFTVSPQGENVAELKYIDPHGYAHTFDESDGPDESEESNGTGELGGLGIETELIVLGGRPVTAKTEPGSYNRPGKSYRVLGDSYLNDLINDCEEYVQKKGAVVFTSDLSKLVNEEGYRAFVAEFCGSVDTGVDIRSYARSNMSYLALDSDCLKPDNAVSEQDMSSQYASADDGR